MKWNMSLPLLLILIFICYSQANENTIVNIPKTGTYPSVDINKNLIGHWTFDNDAHDLSGNNHHGTLFGNPIYVAGISMQAIEFDGKDDYLVLPDILNNLNSGFTFSLWAKPSQATHYARFLDFGSGWRNNNIIFSRLATSNDLLFVIWNSTNEEGRIIVPNAISNNEWQMFTITADQKGNTTIYKNGLLVHTGVISLPKNVIRLKNYIGKSNSNGDSLYQGLIDDVRIYSYALDAKQIGRLYGALRLITINTQSIVPGETAVFELKAINPFTGDSNGLEYQWFKNDTLIKNSNAPRLTITNATNNDVASYYCIVKLVNNDSTSRSNMVYLNFKKLLLHYSFDGNTLDSSGNNFHGKSYGKIEYEKSLSKQAIQFNGTDSYIEIVLPENFNDFSAGLTFSLWAKPSQSIKYAPFFDFGSEQGKANIVLFKNLNSNHLMFQLSNVPGNGLLTPNVINNDEWQMFTISVDSQGTAKVYKNGLLVNTGSVSPPKNVLLTNNYIGKYTKQADAFYAGSIDDFRLYNYAASPKDIATLYSEVNGPICVKIMPWDLNKDCKIGLEDMTILVQHWLECNLFPDCISEIPAP